MPVVLGARMIEPESGWMPAQAPDASQDAAFVDDQFRVIVPPRAKAKGPTVKATDGAGTVVHVPAVQTLA